MIDYQTYCQIRQFYTEKKLSFRQIARDLKLHWQTIRTWARRETFQKARAPKRPSKLDPFKGEIVRLLERYDYSAQQIFQQLTASGYPGRYSLVKKFVRQVRPRSKPAFLTLRFAPGECAQVDWGCAGVSQRHLLVWSLNRTCMKGSVEQYSDDADSSRQEPCCF